MTDETKASRRGSRQHSGTERGRERRGHSEARLIPAAAGPRGNWFVSCGDSGGAHSSAWCTDNTRRYFSCFQSS